MKYFSHKVTIDGETFDSKKEYYRWKQLEQRQRDGCIEGLRRQVRFEILPKLTHLVEKKLKTKVKMVEAVDERAKYYTADFVYQEGGVTIVEDVKSPYTKHIRDYPKTRHLMKLWCIKHSNETTTYKFRETI